MVLKTIGFFPRWFEACRLGFSFCFSILDINGYVQSEIADDALAAIGAEWASNGGAETEVPVVEEPPAKTAQGRRPTLRPRPNLTADKRVGNGENVGQGPTVPPDDNASDGAV
ncbi:hypothetical protein MRX96_003100 [Rhipicephalus microplus]